MTGDAPTGVDPPAAAERCPFRPPGSLPGDGTPLRPSPSLAHWRELAPAVALRYDDGHEGLLVTRYDLARAVLQDQRFSQQPHRTPTGPSRTVNDGRTQPPPPARPGQPLDAEARESRRVADLLSLDGEVHVRIRRAITARFTVRQVRARREWVSRTVARQLDHLRAQGSPADLTTHYAVPISVLTHCQVIGVPDHLVGRFGELFVEQAPEQQHHDFIRQTLRERRGHPGEDVITDLLASDLTSQEIEGVLLVLMASGRDSVAYLIVTAMFALLSNPGQLQLLREDPSKMGGAMEEFMRVGAMFLTLFPRTATEDLELDGVRIRAQQTVSVSAVAANRDPRQFERPDDLDIERDAFGHLGFGHGPHGCVGQQLARLEITEAILQLLAGMPALRLIEAEQEHPMPFANPVATYEAGSLIVAWD